MGKGRGGHKSHGETNVTIRIDPRLKRQAAFVARAERVTMSSLVKIALDSYTSKYVKGGGSGRGD